MDLDLQGRINNTKLPLSNGLHPVFEAIINSIHAIEETKEKGCVIEIEVIRDTSQGSLIEGEPILNQPIIGFVVHDNGIGFTDAHFKSFQTSDTTTKRNKGGKGVGRFLWLKAFDKIEVESVYQQGSTLKQRKFEFQVSHRGIENEQVIEVKDVPRKTMVRLSGFKTDYRQHPACPRSASTIARRIIEHFLEYFILDTCPKIRLHDNYEQTDIDLNRMFSTEMRLDAEHKDYQVKTQRFRITHVRLLAPQDTSHALSFCANDRPVKVEPLPKLIPNLDSALNEPKDGRKFFYAGYVSAKVLDASANAERTRFDMLDETTDNIFPNELSWNDIVDAAVARARLFLEPYTQPLNEAKKERIKQFVTTKAPQYRPLLKHKADRIDALRSNLTDDQLDVELYKIDQEWDGELREEYRKLLDDKDETATTHQEFRTRYERFLEVWNESGISKLARYVVHRKATLDFLEERRKLKSDGKYSLEDAIHEIVFPLKKTSDDIRIDNMNLWIIDEKLVYHYFLASDRPLNQIAETIEIDSKERPDLLIFNRSFAFADSGPPFSAIVIIEFKRPARDDYSEKEKKNPILQVYDYIELLKGGKAKDRRGVPINVPDHLPIYAYIICDLTPTLQKQAKDYQLTKTPDSQGFFGYHKEYGAYIEVISFDKLIDDARKRNKVLFDKLGLEAK